MNPDSPAVESHADSHLAELSRVAKGFGPAAARLSRWGWHLAATLAGGGRLLVAGNGGSAAQAQHLAAELVGRLRHDRVPLSAFALSADTSALTAIGNDYGYPEVFARQVRAHGRDGDVVLLMSTSGRSENVINAADAAVAMGLQAWAFTGASPNPLASRCHETIAVPSGDNQVVQELHLVATHLLCSYVDSALPQIAATRELISAGT